MNDSSDMSGDGAKREDEAKPSAAELETAGQNALFGEPAGQSGAPSGPAPSPGPAPTAAEQQRAATPPADAPPVQGAPDSRPAPAQSPMPGQQPYRVLARKYRPQTFSELIGQDAMVRTLANAIQRDRLAHAFLMTGVRGVGKTSTARLIAKALNCVGPDGQGGPTIDPCGVCEPCTAIAEGRHIDVIEMDAASHTGVDDVREIIEAVRYAAVSARYKIYIIDEVHMLSRNAFNALLKTLEEPPAHVKFLFATTEVEKLPVTVLSRTQRFDLRRIPTDLLHQHFASVCRQEGVEAEEEALALVAAAAEGSVRDGLSILDQAIAHADMEGGQGSTTVHAARVRDMLGLADKSAQRRLFEALLEGDPQGLLQSIDRQYALGMEPVALMRGMMELTHRIAVAQVAEGAADAPTQEERQAIGEWSQRLSAGQVHRLWQLLLKGHDEVRGAPDPLAAAQMALLRVLHAADMPDPGKLAKTLEQMATQVPAPAAVQAAQEGAPAPQARQPRWADLVERVENSHLENAMSLATRLRMQVRVIALEEGRLVYTQPPGFVEAMTSDIRQALGAATGRAWEVEKSEGEGAPTLVEQQEAAERAERDRIREAPLVKAALSAFPGAEFVEQDDAPHGQANWNRRA